MISSVDIQYKLSFLSHYSLYSCISKQAVTEMVQLKHAKDA